MCRTRSDRALAGERQEIRESVVLAVEGEIRAEFPLISCHLSVSVGVRGNICRSPIDRGRTTGPFARLPFAIAECQSSRAWPGLAFLCAENGRVEYATTLWDAKKWRRSLCG